MGETGDRTVETAFHSSGSESVALRHGGEPNERTGDKNDFVSRLDFRGHESVSRRRWENPFVSTRSEHETNVDVGRTQRFAGQRRIRGPRLDETFARFQTFDGNELLGCIKKLIEVDADWVPSSKSSTLYIRPTLIGTEVKRRKASLGRTFSFRRHWAWPRLPNLSSSSSRVPSVRIFQPVSNRFLCTRTPIIVARFPVAWARTKRDRK